MKLQCTDQRKDVEHRLQSVVLQYVSAVLSLTGGTLTTGLLDLAGRFLINNSFLYEGFVAVAGRGEDCTARLPALTTPPALAPPKQV